MTCKTIVEKNGCEGKFLTLCPATCEFIANIGKKDGNEGAAADEAGKVADA